MERFAAVSYAHQQCATTLLLTCRSDVWLRGLRSPLRMQSLLPASSSDHMASPPTYTPRRNTGNSPPPPHASEHYPLHPRDVARGRSQGHSPEGWRHSMACTIVEMHHVINNHRRSRAKRQVSVRYQILFAFLEWCARYQNALNHRGKVGVALKGRAREHWWAGHDSRVHDSIVPV